MGQKAKPKKEHDWSQNPKWMERGRILKNTSNKMQKVEVHILAGDEAEIIPYALRHYSTFCSRIVLESVGSSDGTIEIAKQLGAEIREWDSGNKVDDRVNQRIKNECWLGTDADWVICADADELVFFPQGAKDTLDSYTARKLPLVKPYGWEMTSDVFPTTTGQIYDEVKFGARDDRWYGKACIFSPKLVKRIEFSAGAHQTTAFLHDGRVINSDDLERSPSAALLHYHQIGPIERIAAKYDRTRARMCDANIQYRWGNFEPGIKHATDKRDFIKSRLEKVIP